MQIPHTQLSPKTLAAIVLEFVTRDGTDHSLVNRRVDSVMRQLESGRAELHYDPESNTCGIVRV